MIAQPQRADSTGRANFNHLLGDIAWFGLALAATSRFLSVYAIRLGATPADLGWLSSLPALFLLLSASFASWWSRRFGDPVRSIFLPGLGMRLLFLLLAFAPLLPLQWQPLWLILSVSLPAIPQGVASVTFLGIIRDSVEPSVMTRLLSLRQLALNITIAIAAVAFGIWLEQAPFPLNYQVMFLLAFAFSLMSLWHCIRIRLVVPVAVTPAAPTPVSNVWRSRSFQRFAIIAAGVHIAFFTIVPVTPLFLVNRLGGDEGYMALFALLELSAGAAASILAPRMNDRIGTRTMVALSMIGTAVAALVIAFSPNLYVALIAAVISGASWTAGAGVGLFRLFVDNAPEGEMTGYSTAYNQVIGLSVFIGPMLGSMLANGGVDLVLVMVIGALLRLLVAPLVDVSLISRWRAHRRSLQPAH